MIEGLKPYAQSVDDFSQDNPHASSSVQSVFYRIPSAFIRVHLRLISVSLSDRTRKIQFELFPIINDNGFVPVLSGILRSWK